MMLSHFLTALVATTFSTCAYAAPTPQTEDIAITNSTSSGHTPGGAEHIVLLDASAPPVEEVLARLALTPDHPDVLWTFNNSVFRGFVGNMNTHCLTALANMSDVSHEASVTIESLAIRRDAAAAAAAPLGAITSRNQATWGLQRLSSSAPVNGEAHALNYTYRYDASTEPGKGVDIYVIDAGLDPSHAIFTGRAYMGWSFSADATPGGHGIHTAGTAGGAVVGVASAANVIGVKVLGTDGRGSTGQIIAGMSWAVSNHDARKGAPGFVGSVVNLSLGIGGVVPSMLDVVTAAAKAGIHFSIAAGNNGGDACMYSPAMAGGYNSDSVVTVGSIAIDDTRSSFSNNGSCVDIYAPGETVLSAWNGSATEMAFEAGTSMATPHVAGTMAYLMALEPEKYAGDPVALKGRLLDLAGTTAGGDKILSNGVTGTVAPARREKRWVGEGSWDVEDESVGRSYAVTRGIVL